MIFIFCKAPITIKVKPSRWLCVTIKPPSCTLLWSLSVNVPSIIFRLNECFDIKLLVIQPSTTPMFHPWLYWPVKKIIYWPKLICLRWQLKKFHIFACQFESLRSLTLVMLNPDYSGPKCAAVIMLNPDNSGCLYQYKRSCFKLYKWLPVLFLESESDCWTQI